MSQSILSRAACLGAFAACFSAAQSALGVIEVSVIDDSFTAAEGYNDGLLQFQAPDGAGNGIWLGQDITDVDSVEGTVNGVGIGFRRNIWSLGATGGVLGGTSDELGNGFLEGDIIKISSDFRFDFGPAILNNVGIYNFGVRDCFATCGFQAAPTAGVETGYSNFGAGNLKIFTHYDREVFTGADNPFGTFVSGPDMGIINGKDTDNNPTGEALDLVSDNLRIEYVAELTDASTDTWTATSLIVTNLDTETILADAAVDNPQALESFQWNQDPGLDDDPFTLDIDESTPGGVAVSSGTDMWFAGQWVPSGNAEQTTTVSNVSFEYTRNSPPLDGDYNSDGVVDAADYTVYRDTAGQIGGGLAADGTGDDLLGVPDGDVDSFDRDFWAANFGASAFGTATAIPEPVAAVLAGVALVAGGLRSRRNG